MQDKQQGKQPYEGWSALMIAAWRDDETVLHWASSDGYVDVVQLLVKHGAAVNQPRKDGKTPLMLAAENNHLVVIQTLLKNGAKIDVQDNQGESALICAAKCNSETVVDYLLKRDADSNGDYLLHLAIKHQHVMLTNLLLKHGADEKV